MALEEPSFKTVFILDKARILKGGFGNKQFTYQ